MALNVRFNNLLGLFEFNVGLNNEAKSHQVFVLSPHKTAMTATGQAIPVRERRPDPEVGRPEVAGRDGDGLDGARVEGEAVEDDQRHRHHLDSRRGRRQRGSHVAQDGIAV